MHKTSCSLTFTGKNSLFSNDEINIVALEGEEGVSSLYHFDITIAVATNNANSQWGQMKKMLNEPVKLLLTYHHKEASKEEKLQWHGMITSVIQDGRDDEHCYYQLLLEPKVAKLRWLFSSDVYLEKQLDGIINDVMKQANFDAFRVIRKQDIQPSDNYDYIIDSEENDKFSDFLPHSYQHFTCQFEESSLDFLQRRLEFYGVHYWFSQLDEKACMIYAYDLKIPEADSPEILKAEYNAVYSSEATHDSIAITHLSKRLNTHANQLYLQRSSSYFNTVEEKLQPASHQLFEHSEEMGSYYSSLDQFELLEKSNGDKPLENRCISGEYLAKIRAEAAQAKQAQVTGTAVNLGITAGRFIRIEDQAIETILRATDSDSEEGQRQNDYFVLSVKHRWGNSDKTQWKNKKSSLQNYQADFVLHPCFTEDDQPLPFYPQQRTPTPRIEHMVSGFIDGVPYKKQDNPNAPSTIDTSYPNIDEQGRYRVRFAFAKQLKASYAKNSAWVRLATPFAGGTPHREFDEKGQAVNTDKGYNYSGGMHFPLRPGTEVLIAFVNGDPDYPVIVSALPNVEAPSPVTCGMYSNNKVIQPDNRNQFVLQTPVGNRMTVHDIAPEKINGKWKDSTRSAWQFYTPAMKTQLNLGAFYYEAGKDADRKTYGSSGFMLSTEGQGIINSQQGMLIQSPTVVKISSGEVGKKFDKFIASAIPGYKNSENTFETPKIEDSKNKYWHSQSYEWSPDDKNIPFKYKAGFDAKMSVETTASLSLSVGAAVDIKASVSFGLVLGASFKLSAGFKKELDLGPKWTVQFKPHTEYTIGEHDLTFKHQKRNILQRIHIGKEYKAIEQERDVKVYDDKLKAHTISVTAVENFQVQTGLQGTSGIVINPELSHLTGTTTEIAGTASAKVKVNESELEVTPTKAMIKTGKTSIRAGMLTAQIDAGSIQLTASTGTISHTGNLIKIG